MVRSKLFTGILFLNALTCLSSSPEPEKFGLVINNIVQDTRALQLKNDWPLQLWRKINMFKLTDYSYASLELAGLSQADLDILMCEYIKRQPKAYLGLVWPAACCQYDEIRKIVKKYCTIVAEKDVLLINNGPALLLKNIPEKAKEVERFLFHYFPENRKDKPVRVFVLEANSCKITRECKYEVRKFLGVYPKPYVMHINDTHAQTVELSRLLFNQNSIHLLNTNLCKKRPKFNTLLEKYRGVIANSGIADEDICIDGSSVLAVYGLRDVNVDFDFLTLKQSVVEPYLTKPLDMHNGAWLRVGLDIKDVIYNPLNHLWFNGLKFAALHTLRDFKDRQGRPVDLSDLELIDRLSQNSFTMMRNTRSHDSFDVSHESFFNHASQAPISMMKKCPLTNCKLNSRSIPLTARPNILRILSDYQIGSYRRRPVRKELIR